MTVVIAYGQDYIITGSIVLSVGIVILLIATGIAYKLHIDNDGDFQSFKTAYMKWIFLINGLYQIIFAPAAIMVILMRQPGLDTFIACAVIGAVWAGLNFVFIQYVFTPSDDDGGSGSSPA